MNRRTYERLSPEDRAIIDKYSGEAYARLAGRGWNEINAWGLGEARKAGNTIAEATPELKAALEELNAKFVADYVEQVKGAGARRQRGHRVLQGPGGQPRRLLTARASAMAAHSHFRAADRVRGLGPAARLLALVACILLFAMMIIVFIDVLGRYLFLAPLPAAYEPGFADHAGDDLLRPAADHAARGACHRRPARRADPAAARDAAAGGGEPDQRGGAGAGGLAAVGALDRPGGSMARSPTRCFLPLWPFSAGMSVLCAVAALAALATAGRHAARWFRRG
ncbi:MAG: hypothetical protein KatS3mg118_0838 [Paracoccaceae bacterium]|nr:MAG: hypothetical protein KatS3mg118_0838 [Paracoccaceae bacterium]